MLRPRSASSGPAAISELISQAASVGQSATQAATLPAVEAAKSPIGLLSRLRGGLSLRAGAGSGVAPPAGILEPASATEVLPKPLGPYPDTVPFPLAECVSQAPPLDAIAVQQGLPSLSPMSEAMDSKQQFISWLALLACGSIFGASIGLLTRIVRLTDFNINSQAADWKFAGLCVLGVFMFWVLGRVAFAAAALASEERHLHLVASHRDDPLKVGDWLRRASWVSLGLLVVISGVLVAIEAVVERNGIVSAFTDGMQNATIASGQHDLGSNSVNPVALVFMVLTVSLPFVLMHIAHGWSDARQKVIRQYLIGRQQQQAWEIARKCHAERTEMVNARYAQERENEERERQKAREEDAQAKRDGQAAALQAATDIHTGNACVKLGRGCCSGPRTVQRQT